ncbi:MAG: ribonuclease HII [Thermodesulfobacteriota bacterium]
MPSPQPLFTARSGRYDFEGELLAKGYRIVAGVDEAGRGPLAGPVVAACVVLPAGCDPSLFDDSKKLTDARRRQLFAVLRDSGAAVGIGVVSEKVIDEINILQASLLAMRRAVAELAVSPDYLLVDGNQNVPLPLAQTALVKGDSRCASIGAASIVAKVVRDDMMDRYDEEFPLYGFRQHKGYPTGGHRAAIRRHGPCAIHRRSFRGVREFLGKEMR